MKSCQLVRCATINCAFLFASLDRKPIKTHKVSANFEEVDHYDEFLRDGIPDALLEGLGFNEAGICTSGADSKPLAACEMYTGNKVTNYL
jgi:hypothetical protein